MRSVSAPRCYACELFLAPLLLAFAPSPLPPPLSVSPSAHPLTRSPAAYHVLCKAQFFQLLFLPLQQRPLWVDAIFQSAWLNLYKYSIFNLHSKPVSVLFIDNVVCSSSPEWLVLWIEEINQRIWKFTFQREHRVWCYLKCLYFISCDAVVLSAFFIHYAWFSASYDVMYNKATLLSKR